MPNPSVLPTSPLAQEAFVRGDFQQRAAGLYDPAQLKLITDRLAKSSVVQALPDDERDEFLSKILAERAAVVRHLKNVKRQEAEIKGFELNPGKANVAELATQMQEMLPYEGAGPKWRARHHGYGDGVGSNFWSFAGGSEREVREILERDEPIIHTKMPDKNYRNNVIDGKRRVVDEIRVNERRLEVFLAEGRDLTPEEEQETRKRSQLGHRLSNLGESCLGGLLDLTGAAGRGLLSKSKASEDPRHEKYLQNRNELLSQVLWRLDPKSASYPEILKKVNSALATSPDLMDQATFANMQNLITAEIAKETGVNEKDVKEFNDKIQKLNGDMLSGLQKRVDSEDDMWKYRVLQAFLILTPIGGFSLLGNVFSWVDPFAQLVGPVFDGSTSLSDGIASMATSDVLGPFGDIADALGIDDAISWLLENIPVVSEFGDVFDALTDNEMAQNLFGTIAPMLNSPIIPLYVAGVYSIMRTDTEVKHYCDVSDFKEAKEKELQTAFDAFKETTAGKPLEDRIKIFAQARLNIMKKANAEAELAKFVFGASDEELKIFDGLKLGAGADQKDLSTLKQEGKFPTAVAAFTSLSSNPAVRDECLKRFLLFRNVADDRVAFERERVGPDFGAKVVAQRQTLDQEFILRAAKEANFTTIQTDQKAMCVDFEKQLIRQDSDQLYSIARQKTPSPNVAAAGATPLHGATPLYRTS